MPAPALPWRSGLPSTNCAAWARNRFQELRLGERLIWANLCAAVLTRRVAMCARHISDEIVTALLVCASIASAFRDGDGVLACQRTTL